MSDILTLEEEAFVLLTSLATEQAIRTADILGAKAIVLVNGKRAAKTMLALAKQCEISVLNTPYRMFKACHLLGKALESEGLTI